MRQPCLLLLRALPWGHVFVPIVCGGIVINGIIIHVTLFFVVGDVLF